MGLSIQSWLIILAFFICVVFSIVMLVYSESFRNRLNLNDFWMISLFFLIAFVISATLFFNVHCAVEGSGNIGFCGAYAWLMTIIVIFVLAGFIAQGIYFHFKDKVQEEKEKK